MNQSSSAPVMQGGPGSFFQTWIDALTKPSEQTFANMAASPSAKATTAYIWVFVVSLIGSVIGSLTQGSYMRQILEQRGLGQNLPAGGLGSSVIGLVCGAPIVAVISVILFAIVVALVQWIARMFGGHGTFDQLAYCFAAIAVPFSLISSVVSLLGLIPFAGFCVLIIVVLLSLYVLFLHVVAAKGVNQFGWGQAAGSVLIPIAVVFLLCCCLVFVLMTLMGAAIGSVFSSINQSLMP